MFLVALSPFWTIIYCLQPVVLSVPPQELSVGPFKSNNSVCQMLINAGYDQNFVGGSLLKHYYSIWDQGNAHMGFAA
jgi:hypothetical protein